ncbi:SMI1/KNR4 family protein [Gordonia sp. ABSL11-1]|uniref:SMI1/KNR4 family protein n=1 Tax=Gordonia sp. ABSL11-1 TaxID=3053924 RepID=UPI0025727E3C|nr:SMI1/KNR4 family protein [Gordonia sp. ABSL11-1]MDL9944583.1 SMI1/KNR4 family protein [Gordonia sp. ABSL11-1]
MKWIAALQEQSGGVPGVLSEVVATADSLIGGDREREVLAEARSRLTPGGMCSMYQLPPDGHVESIEQAAASALSAPKLHRYSYRSGSANSDVDDAEERLGVKLPPLWRRYLTSPSLFSAGWLASGEFVAIYPPKDIVDVTNAYYEWVPRNGAVMVAGGAGGSEWLQLDTVAGDDSPVVLLSSGGQGWEDTIIQTDSIDEFVSLIEAHRFQFAFDDRMHYEPRR